MKTRTHTSYVCEICGQDYDTMAAAKRCEERPLLGNGGTKVGDVVRVMKGDGAGSLCKVEDMAISTSTHAIVLRCKFVDQWGHRVLRSTEYERT